MWTKIKKALAWIGGGLIAVLFFVLGIKNRKIKKTVEQLESVEEELEIVEEVHEKEEVLEDVAQSIEEKTEAKIDQIKTETVEMLVEEVQMEETGKKYNEMIGSWNNGE